MVERMDLLADQLHQRGLAGPVGPDDGGVFPFTDSEGDVIEDINALASDGCVFYVYDGIGHAAMVAQKDGYA